MLTVPELLLPLLPILIGVGLVVATVLTTHRNALESQRREVLTKERKESQRRKRRAEGEAMGAGAVAAAPDGAAPATVDAGTAAQIRELMDAARAKLAEGDGDGAIACALAAAKLSSGGDEAVMTRQLDAAKRTAETQRRRQKEIRPDLTDEEAADLAAARAVCDDLLERSSILGDGGHRDLLQDAFEDGSSVVCVRCGDLVARRRWDAHKTAWCRMLPDYDSDDDDGGERS